MNIEKATKRWIDTLIGIAAFGVYTVVLCVAGFVLLIVKIKG